MAPEIKRPNVPPQMNRPQFKSNDGPNWGVVTIGGVAGVMLGGGAAYAATQLSGDEEVDIEKLPEVSLVDDVQEHAFVADDSDSFADAFAAARDAQGPGGTFIWHGKLFNTYTADEWNDMSQAERNAFTHDAVVDHNDEVVLAQEGELKPTAVPDVTEVPDMNEDAVAGYLQTGTIEDLETVTLPDGSNVIAGTINVDGYKVFLFDTDGDGTFDTAACDYNGDGSFDLSEAVDVSGLDQSVSDFADKGGFDLAEQGITLDTDDDGGIFDVFDSDSTDVAEVDSTADSSVL